MKKQKDFIEIIKQNEGTIFKVTLLYANNKEDQKDLYQEIVYQLWKSFDSFRNESKINTWLYRIALNTSITQLKREKKKGDRIPIDKVLLNRIDQIDQVMETRVQLLYKHIKELSTVERSIILLFLEGNSYEEIADVTGFSVTNIGTRLARIKQKLKSQINK